MNEAPKRIWLQDNGNFALAQKAGSDLTWCEHRINDGDTEYVRADLLRESGKAARKPGGQP